ncbi:hypothetical protein SAV14893_047020 [Streptomyces avermitilis]|uniref:Uncharacterized protein n=1 Tax=Streptomyces avermitilis TaxID=33903 RepID=A0A4D4M1K1_STRAX|nr:hypothetical protein SAV14893_047020 [Streptomyces avermitilis]
MGDGQRLLAEEIGKRDAGTRTADAGVDDVAHGPARQAVRLGARLGPRGEADQAPTQVPVEAGAAELRGGRSSARALWSWPSSAPAPMYMAAEMATMSVHIAASKA